ncbi:MAG: hypothetical protein WD397_11820 [Wenzhouxiangellaceae bacterium]
MRKGILLAASITAVYAQGTVAQDAGDAADLGTIVVTAPPLEPPRTIELGSGGNGSDEYFWGDTQQGNQNDGGSITPNDFENPDPENPAICALMSQAGLPEGCTRSFVAAGLPAVNSVISDPWQFDRLSNFAANGQQLRGHFVTSLAELRNCYSDQANDPAFCETRYRTRIRNVCNTHAIDAPTFWMILADPIPDRELCLQGADNIDLRMGVTSTERTRASWYESIAEILGLRVQYQVAMNLAVALLPWMNQYNELLVLSREWRNCATIIDAWDANGCGSSLPG